MHKMKCLYTRRHRGPVRGCQSALVSIMRQLYLLLLLLTSAVHLIQKIPFSVALTSTQGSGVHSTIEKRNARLQPGNNMGNEFYIGFMENYVKPLFQSQSFLIINQSTLFMTTTDHVGSTVMIESEQGMLINTLSPGITTTRRIHGYKVQSVRDRNKGMKVKVEESKQIHLFALNEELHSVDGFTALPCLHFPSVSPYEYYAVSVPRSTSTETTADSAFLIVACSDNTTVTVTPTQSVEHPYFTNLIVSAGSTFSVTLQERETLYVQSREDLTGSKVESTAPISFFTGHECGNVPADIGECDHLVEQIPPTVTWGNQFIVAPTATRGADDIIKIVSSEHTTHGNVSCIDVSGDRNRFTITISRDEKFQDINLPFDTYCYIETDKPVLVVQLTPGEEADEVDSGDPFMVIVPAVSQYLMNTTFTTVNGLGLFFNNYINIFVPSDSTYQPNILVDGVPVLTDDWVAIPCFYNHTRSCGYAATMNISEGVHTIWNADSRTPLGLTVYGLSFLETYAYVGGLQLSLPGLDPNQLPTSHFVLSGQSLCMHCQNRDEPGQSTTAIDWTRGGESLMQTTQRRVASNGSLCIQNATTDDAGNYTCYMLGEPYPHRLSVIGGIIVEPPKCSSTDKGALVGVGMDTAYIDSSTSAVQVCCRVVGPPGTIVEWFVDGTLISKETSDYALEEGYIRYSGTMTEGCITFTCQANLTSSTLLAREYSKVCIGSNSAPLVVNITGVKSVLEHTSASYQCSTDGFPLPTRIWSADRDRENFLPETATDHGNGTLTIDPVTEMDGHRKFCCDARNEHGQQSNCINLNILIPPEIAKHEFSSMLIISVPTIPLDTSQNVTITVGMNIMIPETYNVTIECSIRRANPMPSISWFHNNESIQSGRPPFTMRSDGTLLIEGIVRGRDDGIYTCVADTVNIGRDESSSTVIVTIPPKLNNSHLTNVPGNCLDLTQSSENDTQQIGVDLCARAGPNRELTLRCEVLQGEPTPEVKWLRDGKDLAITLSADSYENTTESLILTLPDNASSSAKQAIEGNYSCVATNVAGVASASSYIIIIGDIPMQSATTEFIKRQSELYHQLHQTLSDIFPGVQDASEQLMFFTSGKVLSYDDFDPGYRYDESEESILPQTMENMFDLVDVIPDAASIVFNPYRAQRLQETYSKLLDMLQVAPSSLRHSEQQEIRTYLLETVQDFGSSSNASLPRLSLYLLYKNSYYMTVFEVDGLIDSQRQTLFNWEFSQWYEHNVNILNNRKEEALTKWKMFAYKDEVEERLHSLTLTDYSQEINAARVLLLSNRRQSRFKDQKVYYLVRLYPDTWYKSLINRVRESIQQMQFQLTTLKTEIHILETTIQYLEKEAQKQEILNALFPSRDPIQKLYCELDEATFQLEDIVKASEDMRYKCLASGNPADCHPYWDLREYIRDEVVANYTEFYWYVHTIEAALNHRDYSIPAISSAIHDVQLKITNIQISINIALSDLAERNDNDPDEERDFLSEFLFRPQPQSSQYNFRLPPSMIGRLLWYINPESTHLVPREVTEEYNLTFNHMNTAVTNMSAKIMSVNIHRRWLKMDLFNNEHLNLKTPVVMVSPGVRQELREFHNMIRNGTYQLPLYPTSLLLATDIELTVDVPFIFHTLPTLIKLSYDPHITGGFGPFSFGPLHRASAGNIKFRVGIRDNQITITLPGTQLIGFVCDVVPKHPTEYIQRGRRSVQLNRDKESHFDQWLYRNKTSTSNGLFHKDARDRKISYDSITSSEDGGRGKQLITPTNPTNRMHPDLVHYSVSTNSSTYTST